MENKQCEQNSAKYHWCLNASHSETIWGWLNGNFDFLVHYSFKYKNNPLKSDKEKLALRVTREAIFLSYGMSQILEIVFTWREKKAKIIWPSTAEWYMTAVWWIYQMTFTSRASLDLTDLNNTSETHIKCWAGYSDHSIQHNVIGWPSRGSRESRLWFQGHSTMVDPLGLVVLFPVLTPICKFLCKRGLGINLHAKWDDSSGQGKKKKKKLTDWKVFWLMAVKSILPCT